MNVIWHNGSFQEDAPVLQTSDRLRLGDGVFDTMLCRNGQPVFVAEHYQRLLFHASILGIELNISQDIFENAAKGLLQKNNTGEAQSIIRTLVTRGPAEGGIKPPHKPHTQIIMRLSQAAIPSGPIEAVIAQNVRRNEGSPLSRIKSVNYGDQILALQEARGKGADEVILLNNKDYVTCFSAGNIFVVLAGKLYTPPARDGSMEGIIRRKIIERYNAQERSLTAQDLARSEGIYLTNSLRGAVPVRRIDGQDIPMPAIEIDPALHLG